MTTHAVVSDRRINSPLHAVSHSNRKECAKAAFEQEGGRAEVISRRAGFLASHLERTAPRGLLRTIGIDHHEERFMFKTTLPAAAFALALSGSAFAQTSLGAGASAQAEAGTCSSLLAELDNRMNSLAGTVGDTVGSSVGDITGGLGLSGSAGANTLAGSAGASAGASADAGAGSVDLGQVTGLLDRATTALDSGDEEQCLELAAEAEQSLEASAQ